MALLELKRIHTYYGGIHALKNISLSVHEGEIVTLIGSNGAGKSTTLKTISGQAVPKQGDVMYQGIPIGRKPPHVTAAIGIAHVPEGRRIFPRNTVKENMELGAFLVKDKQEVKERMELAFHYFPILKERLQQKGGTMSGGEQQMLAMARALMMRPKIMLLDEPSMGLAPMMVEKIFDIISVLNKEGMTILLVEQNAYQALQIAHRGYVLQSGEIKLSERAELLLENDMVRESYLA
ncbi:ABC transporter ATP-binding protein [Paenibacillus turpanensis]|uniref:ABC transporter ATP-binding protein n=1 Tax=Paenibacillus turpanensis TaxID=2689078 RepID=UPI001408E3C7|nr:ABC transporter ATP-binding protein [Paenibacillus turpanensis]